MKNILVLLLVFVINYNDLKAQVTAKDFVKLKWLTGEWEGTNTKPGTTRIEKWWLNSDNELQGEGIVMKGSDTAFVEKAKLIIKDNGIYYVADVPGNKESVYFKLTSLSDHSFICENPKHDFPKKISYTNDDNNLKATISGNGKSIDYFFKRKL